MRFFAGSLTQRTNVSYPVSGYVGFQHLGKSNAFSRIFTYDDLVVAFIFSHLSAIIHQSPPGKRFTLENGRNHDHAAYYKRLEKQQAIGLGP
jgi:hypothetical protein